MPMSRAMTLTLGLALTLAASNAWAQPGGRGGRGGGPGGFGGPGGRDSDYLSLARQEPIQKELGLTPDQVKKIEELADSSSERRRTLMRQASEASRNMRNQADQASRAAEQQALMQARAGANNNAGAFGGDAYGGGFGGGFGNGGGPNLQGFAQAEAIRNAGRMAGQQTQSAAQQAATKVEKETEAALAKIMDKEQRTRLKQLSLQREGITAVLKPEISKTLNLSPTQIQKIQAVISGSREAQGQAMRAAFANMGRGGRGEGEGQRPQMSEEQRRESFTKMREQAEQATESMEKQIASNLTKKQGATWIKLLGEPFDFEAMDAARRDRFRRDRGGDEGRGERPAPGSTPPGGAGAPAAGPPPGNPTAPAPAAELPSPTNGLPASAANGARRPFGRGAGGARP